MTPAEYSRLKQLFYEMVDLNPAGRSEHLERLSLQNPEAADELRALFAEHDRTGPFLEPPQISAQVHLPERIATYRIERELGAGGSGRVFLAVRADDEFRHPVALKLLNAHAADRDFGRRVRLERRALAQLDHPNIAHLTDWGESAAGPFLAMEYVDGAPIDQYCRERNCDTRARLRLFLQVCDAVEHAHRNLIVHRDLKPGNILVKHDGTVKLLDFGIAKLLDAEDGATATVSPRLTPAYASPEQVRGEGISTATDVYSLGVILHELLAGALPYRLSGRTAAEVSRAVLEQEPVRPKVAADLGDIVLKALRKEPERRYASVEQMAADIRSYLDGRPVSARAGSRAYVFGRFVRRNRAQVALGSLAVCALVAGAAMTTWKWRAAEQNLRVAEQRYSALRGFAHSILSTLNQPSSPSATEARRVIANVTVDYLDRLGREKVPDDQLEMDLALAYATLGNAEGNAFNANRGNSGAALEEYRKAHAILLAQWLSHRDAAHGIELLWSFSLLGNLMADPRAAADFIAGGVPVVAELKERDPRNFGTLNPGAVLFETRGKRLWRSGDLAGAIDSFHQALDWARQAVDERPADAKSLQTAAAENGLLCRLHTLTGEFDAALTEGLESERLGRRLLAIKQTIKTRRDTAINSLFLCQARSQMGDGAGASACIHRTFDELRAIADEDLGNAAAKWDLASAYSARGEISAARGLAGKALADFRAALRLTEEGSAKDPLNYNGARAHCANLVRVGLALSGSSPREAGALLDRAIGVCVRERDHEPSEVYNLSHLARAYDGKARVATDRSAALQALRSSVDYWREVLRLCPLDVELKAGAEEAEQKLAGWPK